MQPYFHISKTFKFDAAHYLPHYQGKCAKIHGHTWKLITTQRQKINHCGLTTDFKNIKDIVNEKVINKLDHSLLNDLIPNPTAELITLWIWKSLSAHLPGLCSLTLYETETSFVTFKPLNP